MSLRSLNLIVTSEQTSSDCGGGVLVDVGGGVDDCVGEEVDGDGVGVRVVRVGDGDEGGGLVVRMFVTVAMTPGELEDDDGEGDDVLGVELGDVVLGVELGDEVLGVGLGDQVVGEDDWVGGGGDCSHRVGSASAAAVGPWDESTTRIAVPADISPPITTAMIAVR